jgi:hypothetical protein
MRRRRRQTAGWPSGERGIDARTRAGSGKHRAVQRGAARRKRAVEAGDVAERRRLEKILKEKNPDYFSYLDVEERLKAIGGAR